MSNKPDNTEQNDDAKQAKPSSTSAVSQTAEAIENVLAQKREELAKQNKAVQDAMEAANKSVAEAMEEATKSVTNAIRGMGNSTNTK